MSYFTYLTDQLGYYMIETNSELVSKLNDYFSLNMMIGLVFDVLLIIFVIIACLLIYSLLLLSVESKTFDFAVMRLVGLTKKGFVGMIMTQASFYVIPSVILGFMFSFPSIYLIQASMYNAEMR